MYLTSRYGENIGIYMPIKVPGKYVLNLRFIELELNLPDNRPLIITIGDRQL